MNITQILPTLQAEKVFRKTPSGRPITDYAIEVIEAVLSDEKNYEAPAIRCLNCCIILSSLLVPEGCVNCGGKDLTTNITQNDIV
jgi:hypothetical protein